MTAFQKGNPQTQFESNELYEWPGNGVNEFWSTAIGSCPSLTSF